MFTTVVTIWQAQGVLMELLDVDAGGATLWLESIASLRGETLDTVAAEVVERRTI
ncbi:MAG TPA: ANTAR domain-containing protein [Ilumatobacteraceae bacterium]|nr:ANTAR domain-containing protein [Ilumatobacteraceae bacterium]